MGQLAMIKTVHLSKEYRLGVIGGTTLRDESQRLVAKLQHKEDPTKKIGSETYEKNERFLALNDVSFEVQKGETVGLIGYNGAGKTTLLKLLTRVTAPTKGDIWLNGRVASMLEVGTGFHPELTGRENIYMNGAILGMTRREIDAKLDEIIQFSECEKFIDTPVKRYSSGMYVKLAFSVAVHLDSEIMLMDEVLAVGDVQFQQKCIDKMRQAVQDEGKTIIYVSHNMNTVRQLCNRCMVLDHGSLVFDGDTEDGISRYMQMEDRPFVPEVDFSNKRHFAGCNDRIIFQEAVIHNISNQFTQEDDYDITFILASDDDYDSVRFMLILFYSDGTRIGKTESSDFRIKKGENSIHIKVPLRHLADGRYYFGINLMSRGQYGSQERFDGVPEVLPFTISNREVFEKQGEEWKTRTWGHILLHPIQVLE